MRETQHKKTTPRFFVLLTLVCIALALAIFGTQEQKLAEIRAEEALLQTEYDALLNEKQRMEYMIEYAQSQDYLIQYAREKLGYVHENDVKFKIEE